MKDRAAIDTIKGYFYQFDYSIDQILTLPNDNDKIVIEGVEDIDVKTATDELAVQCKYYAKSEYNHSVIAGLKTSYNMLTEKINAQVIAVFPDKIKIIVDDLDDFKVAEKSLMVGSYLKVEDNGNAVLIAVIENFQISARRSG